MEYNNDELKEMIKKRVYEQEGNEPVYYAISGSHLYGFPSPPALGGDIDVRGFHMAPASRYWKLGQPQEQYIVNQETVSDGFGDWKHAELVSYELRKFIKLIYNSNFNVIEWLSAYPVYGSDWAMGGLWNILNKYLPMEMPSGYIGMAKTNWYHGEVTVKSHLYTIRGLLAALYVTETGSVEPNIHKLAHWYGDYSALVDDLVETKQRGENSCVGGTLSGRSCMAVESLFEETEDIKVEFQHEERKALKNDLNDWMVTFR